MKLLITRPVVLTGDGGDEAVVALLQALGFTS